MCVCVCVPTQRGLQRDIFAHECRISVQREVCCGVSLPSEPVLRKGLIDWLVGWLVDGLVGACARGVANKLTDSLTEPVWHLLVCWSVHSLIAANPNSCVSSSSVQSRAAFLCLTRIGRALWCHCCGNNSCCHSIVVVIDVDVRACAHPLTDGVAFAGFRTTHAVLKTRER